MLETIIILETLIYIIVSKFRKKEKILIKGKIDIAVILMIVATIIPLICKTYCSLSWTLDIFVMYLTVYSMYILVRNLVTTPKRKNIFINVVLLSSCIIIIFGMDRINFNILKKFYNITLSAQVKDSRMTSTIGYWNATFAYIVSLMIIALGKYLETENKKIAGLYASYVGLAMFAFYFCNSRAGMIIFALIFIIYLFKLKDTKKIISAVLLILFTYIFVAIFEKINKVYNSILIVVLGILIVTVLSYVLGLVLNKIVKKIKIKNIKRNSIIFMCISLICGSSFFFSC